MRRPMSNIEQTKITLCDMMSDLCIVSTLVASSVPFIIIFTAFIYLARRAEWNSFIPFLEGSIITLLISMITALVSFKIMTYLEEK